jgi:LCP family protein required for cell wall assembly
VDPRAPLPPELDPRRGRPAQAGRTRGGHGPGDRGDPGGRLAGHPPVDGPSGYPPPAPPGPLAPPGIGRRRRGQPPGRRGAGHLALLAIKVLAAATSVVVLLVSGFLWLGYRNLNARIGRVDAIGRSTVPDVDGRDQNILIVGSDDRSTATPAELKVLSTTEDPGKNTDTMMLVHVPADGRRATAVSFPRDSWVNIPGFGMGKLNSAYADGAYGSGGKANPDKGRRLLVQTISELSGLRIDHYVEVDLLGFYRISNAVGGVQVCLRQPASDHFSGIDLPAGRQTIQGSQALAFVRQRHGLPNGDLDRIVRQQYFLAAMFRKMKSAGVIGNPVKLTRLLDAIGSSVRMDPGLEPLQLARQVQGLAAGNIDFRTVPNKGSAHVAGRDVVLLDTNALPAFFRSMTGNGSAGKAAPAKTVPRSQVSVTVFNGAGRSGLAGQTATALRSAGFTVTGTRNADTSYARTVVRYAPGNDAQARTLAATIPGADLQEKAGIGDSVQLVLGANFAGVRSGGSAGSSSGGSGGSGGAAASSSPASAPSRTAADAGCIN